MVTGIKQAAEVKDASKKITIGLWKFQMPGSKLHHPSIQVDVDIGDWVCIGGGATGSGSPGIY